MLAGINSCKYNELTAKLEHSGVLRGMVGWLCRTTADVMDDEGDVMELLDVFARQGGARGVFSDGLATGDCYANCKGL